MNSYLYLQPLSMSTVPLLSDGAYQSLVAWIKVKKLKVDDVDIRNTAGSLLKLSDLCHKQYEASVSEIHSHLKAIDNELSQKAVDTIKSVAKKLIEVELARSIASSVLDECESLIIPDFSPEIHKLLKKHCQLRRQHRVIARLLQVYQTSEEAKKEIKSNPLGCLELVRSRLLPLTASACGLSSSNFLATGITQHKTTPSSLPSPTPIATVALSRTSMLLSRLFTLYTKQLQNGISSSSYLKFGTPPILPSIFDDISLSRRFPHGLADVILDRTQEMVNERKETFNKALSEALSIALPRLVSVERMMLVIDAIKARSLHFSQAAIDNLLVDTYTRRDRLASQLYTGDLQTSGQVECIEILVRPLTNLLSSLLLSGGSELTRLDKPRWTFKLAANLWVHAACELLAHSATDTHLGAIGAQEEGVGEVDAVTNSVTFIRPLSWEKNEGWRQVDIARQLGDATADVLVKWLESGLRIIFSSLKKGAKVDLDRRACSRSDRSANESLIKQGGLSGALSRVVLAAGGDVSSSALHAGEVVDHSSTVDWRNREDQLMSLMTLLVREAFDSGAEWFRGYPQVVARLFRSVAANEFVEVNEGVPSNHSLVSANERSMENLFSSRLGAVSLKTLTGSATASLWGDTATKSKYGVNLPINVLLSNDSADFVLRENIQPGFLDLCVWVETRQLHARVQSLLQPPLEKKKSSSLLRDFKDPWEGRESSLCALLAVILDIVSSRLLCLQSVREAQVYFAETVIGHGVIDFVLEQFSANFEEALTGMLDLGSMQRRDGYTAESVKKFAPRVGNLLNSILSIERMVSNWSHSSTCLPLTLAKVHRQVEKTFARLERQFAEFSEELLWSNGTSIDSADVFAGFIGRLSSMFGSVAEIANCCQVVSVIATCFGEKIVSILVHQVSCLSSLDKQQALASNMHAVANDCFLKVLEYLQEKMNTEFDDSSAVSVRESCFDHLEQLELCVDTLFDVSNLLTVSTEISDKNDAIEELAALVALLKLLANEEHPAHASSSLSSLSQPLDASRSFSLLKEQANVRGLSAFAALSILRLRLDVQSLELNSQQESKCMQQTISDAVKQTPIAGSISSLDNKTTVPSISPSTLQKQQPVGVNSNLSLRSWFESAASGRGDWLLALRDGRDLEIFGSVGCFQSEGTTSKGPAGGQTCYLLDEYCEDAEEEIAATEKDLWGDNDDLMQLNVGMSSTNPVSNTPGSNKIRSLLRNQVFKDFTAIDPHLSQPLSDSDCNFSPEEDEEDLKCELTSQSEAREALMYESIKPLLTSKHHHVEKGRKVENLDDSESKNEVRKKKRNAKLQLQQRKVEKGSKLDHNISIKSKAGKKDQIGVKDIFKTIFDLGNSSSEKNCDSEDAQEVIEDHLETQSNDSRSCSNLSSDAESSSLEDSSELLPEKYRSRGRVNTCQHDLEADQCNTDSKWETASRASSEGIEAIFDVYDPQKKEARRCSRLESRRLQREKQKQVKAAERAKEDEDRELHSILQAMREAEAESKRRAQLSHAEIPRRMPSDSNYLSRSNSSHENNNGVFKELLAGLKPADPVKKSSFAQVVDNPNENHAMTNINSPNKKNKSSEHLGGWGIDDDEIDDQWGEVEGLMPVIESQKVFEKALSDSKVRNIEGRELWEQTGGWGADLGLEGVDLNNMEEMENEEMRKEKEREEIAKARQKKQEEDAANEMANTLALEFVSLTHPKPSGSKLKTTAKSGKASAPHDIHKTKEKLALDTVPDDAWNLATEADFEAELNKLLGGK